MIVVLFAVFGISLVGMLIVPLRHIPRIRNFEGEIDAVAVSVLRVRVAGILKRIEGWFSHTAKEAFLKFLDSMLKLFERSAGRIAGSTKNLRLMVQERFRVIPRESLYWKQIRSWKNTNGGAARSTFSEDEHDISNHIER